MDILFISHATLTNQILFEALLITYTNSMVYMFNPGHLPYQLVNLQKWSSP